MSHWNKHYYKDVEDSSRAMSLSCQKNFHKMSIPEKVTAIVNEFAAEETSDAKFRLLIEMGKACDLGEDELHLAEKIEECRSNVWIQTTPINGCLYIRGRADSAIVAGLLNILIRVYSGEKYEYIAQHRMNLDFLNLSTISSERQDGFTYMMGKLIRDVAIAITEERKKESPA